jgi:hypothetical protein
MTVVTHNVSAAHATPAMPSADQRSGDSSSCGPTGFRPVPNGELGLDGPVSSVNGQDLFGCQFRHE